MGISSINMAMAGSWGAYNQKLTQATKSLLETLGIPYNQNITEEEAKRLIKSHMVKKEEKAKEQSLLQNGNNSNKNELFEKAKKLAERCGISVPENVGFQQLLALIETKLQERINSSKNDIDALKELKALSQDLAFLQAQSNGSSGYDNTNQALMASLELMGQYNKNFLNKQ